MHHAFCRWQVCTECTEYCRAPTTNETLYCDGCLQPVHRGCKTASQQLSHPNGGVDDADSKYLPFTCHNLMHNAHCACRHDHQQHCFLIAQRTTISGHNIWTAALLYYRRLYVFCVNQIHVVVYSGNALHVGSESCLFEFTQLNYLFFGSQLPPRTSNI